MSRRPGAADRHALLSGGAYPSSYRNGSSAAYGGGGGPSAGLSGSTHGSGAGGGGGGGLDAYRNVSPFEQPYATTTAAAASASASSSSGGPSSWTNNYSDPYAEYGAPKKEHSYPGLLGNRSVAGTGGASAGFGAGMGHLFGLRTAEQLEEQNDEHLEGLSAKVRILRDITVGIGNEVRDSTKDLNSLSEAFNTASAFLGNTFSRMNHMARRQGGWYCNMMLFLLFVIWIFIFLWWWRR